MKLHQTVILLAAASVTIALVEGEIRESKA